MAADFPNSRYLTTGTGQAFTLADAWSMCCWWYADGLSGYHTIFSMKPGGSGWYIQMSGTTLTPWINYNTCTPASGLSTGTWYCFACTANGSGAGNFVGYHRALGGSFSSASCTNQAGEACDLEIGTNTEYSEHWDGRIAAFKFWNGVVLTPAELYAESLQTHPLRLSHLQAYVPIIDAATAVNNYGPGSDAVSLSGAGSGSLTDAEGPPIRHGSILLPPGVPAGGAPPAGLDIPIAMHHYKQMMGAN